MNELVKWATVPVKIETDRISLLVLGMAVAMMVGVMYSTTMALVDTRAKMVHAQEIVFDLQTRLDAVKEK